MSCALAVLAVTVGCGSKSTVPGGVVQAATTTPAILSGGCESLQPTLGAKNWLYGLGQLNNSANCSTSGPFGVPIPSAGILKNLRLIADPSGALGSSSTGVVTVFVNGNASTLTCTLTATVATGPEPSCSDTIHSVNIVAGDQVAVDFVVQTGGFVFVRAALEKE